MKLRAILPFLSIAFLTFVSGAPLAHAADKTLEQGFKQPPESAKPWTWWHWMGGNVSKQGITADLEAMKRVGIGGLFNFHVGQLDIEGDVKFMSPEWWEMMRFSAEEGKRLGLQMGFHNCPGWSSSGGPWVKVEQSMQKLVWSETKFNGPGLFAGALPVPTVDPQWNYYRDISVLAVPDSAEAAPHQSVTNLTAQMNAQGQLKWDAPAGSWIIFRFGHTTTGKKNSPACKGGEGLECDKMSREAVEAHFREYPEKILKNAGAARKAVTTIEIDSYEAGLQDWTPQFQQEFKKRRGYDPILWLPVWANRTIDSKECSERFRWDMNRTIAELFADNYYGRFAELVHQHPGVQFAVEPYTGPFDTATVGARADVVMCEFWLKPSAWGWESVKPVASVVHTLGKKIVSAESFTGMPLDSHWQQDPYALKSTGDKAFCQGVNRLVLHTYTHQPWMDKAPGMVMGWWGTQFSRTQTWWEQSKVWFDYLSRCQFLLQQGEFVGDILVLSQEVADPISTKTSNLIPSGYDSDFCGEEVFLRDVSVKNGRLVLPCGESYRLLVMPDRDTMTPAVARKLRKLVLAGATVVGQRPTRSPSLQDFPSADNEVRKIAEELWGSNKVTSGKPVDQVLSSKGVKPDFQSPSTNLLWIHRQIADADLYFVSNQEEQECTVECSFRMTGKQPELWDAATGEIRDAGTFQIEDGVTRVPLHFDPSGSIFVVFRHSASGKPAANKSNWTEFKPVQEISGPWALNFNPKWGGPEQISFDTLSDWAKRPEQGIRYYSGTATYEKSFTLGSQTTSNRLWLDLGSVKNLAEVQVNGKSLGVLWKPPFRVEITGAVKSGTNRLVIKVTNLWPNRLIGDEQEPDDCEWSKPAKWDWFYKEVTLGQLLTAIPAWAQEGKPRPSKGRFTFTAWKFFDKNSPLLESGLLGPVRLLEPKDINY